MTDLDPYVDRLNKQIDAISPGASKNLHRIEKIDPVASIGILVEIVETACQATHAAAICYANELALKLPRSWLEQHLASVAKEKLNLEDEWEYRRLMELVTASCPSLLPDFLEIGRSSKNEEIRDAVDDYG